MYNHRTVMDVIYKNRRLRLRQLIAERCEWNQTRFAKAFGFHLGSINAYFNGMKPIGDHVAGRIEEALGLPKDWMDSKPPQAVAQRASRKVRVGPPPKVHSVQKLVNAGYTQAEIAQQFGVHYSTISHALKRERAVKKERRHTARTAA